MSNVLFNYFFIYCFIYFNFYIFFIFNNNQGKLRKVLKKLNIYCYLYQIQKQWLVTTVAKFYMCEQKVSNLIYLFFLLITEVGNAKYEESIQLQWNGCRLFVLLISLCVNEKSTFSCIEI